MRRGAPELLTWLFGMVGLLYMLGKTTNPLGFVALAVSTYWIYRLLKKEEAHEIANG